MDGTPFREWGTGALPREVRGLQVDEQPVAFDASGAALFVPPLTGIPVPISRLDPARGGRRLVRVVRPPDPVGVTDLVKLHVTPDARHYAYTYRRVFAHLYMLEGVR